MVKNKSMLLYRSLILMIIMVLSLLYLSHAFILPDGSLKQLWEIKAENYINAYAISDYGNRIAIGKADGKVTVFGKEGGKIYQHAFSDPVQGLFFSEKGDFLYVQTYNILKVDLSNHSVLWEKFISNHYINQFWILNNGNLGFLFANKTSIDYIFMLTNENGATIHQFDLPQLYDDFESKSSPDSNFYFIATEGSDLYHMNLDGMVNWMMRLDPPAMKANHIHPIHFDVNPKGEVCLAYTYEQFGSQGHLMVYFDDNGDMLWKEELHRPALKIQFSADGHKILANTSDELFVYAHNGRPLMDLDQFGYHSLEAEIYFNRLIVNFFSKHKASALSHLNKMNLPSRSILRSINIDQSKIKWQKILNQDHQYFLATAEGRVFLEIIKPDLIRLYQYESLKKNKGRCMHGSVEL